ncbi:MAG: endo alpha-1,4 polygalactosaminidase [Deltaproteobacteria bacterium]|nr:endo alpha-1,4 polygalactosaminidase [Deltaproteobacteria bacterium]
MSFYGTAKAMGELSKAAANFAILNVDADPAIGNFTPGELAQLRKGGANRVLSYLNLGACEQFRSYWAQAPAGLLPCKANKAAQLGPYAGYPNEVWMNPANQAWRALILQHIAPRLVAQGIDGFYLDNLELVEHGPTDGNGPCDAACRQGGLGLVAALRAHYPQLLLVMQNATSAVTRQAVVDGVKFASLLDGVAREQALWPGDVAVQQELAAWQALGLQPGGRPFWVGTLDYVGHCGAKAAAEQVFAKAKAAGLSPYVTDKSGGQQVVCYW